MKRNKLLRAFSLADEKYVAEADPTKEKKAKASLIRKFVLAACLCLIMTACNIVLFTPYDTTPPDVSEYSDSEYYPIIEKLNALTYQKPRYKNNFEYLSNKISRSFLSAKAEDDGVIMENATGIPSYGVPTTPSDKADGGESYEEITDNQVKDVTEGDRIKRSDKFIFYLDAMQIKSFEIGEGALTLIDVLPLTVTGNTNVSDIEFYLSKDCRTITAVIPYWDHTIGGDAATKIQSISVSEAGELKAESFITVDGYYKTSRLIDDKFILVSQFFLNKTIDFSDQTTYIPTVSENGGERKPISPECITVPERIDRSAYTVIYKLDEKTLQIEGQSALLSYTEELYMTKENVYVTRGYMDRSEEDGYEVTQRMTDIVCISLADGFENKGEITLAGYINDRYSLDEYNGILRVVTTTDVSRYKQNNFGNDVYWEAVTDSGAWGTSANLYCVSTDNCEVVAGVYQFAPVGENVRSVRYDGNMAYVCTAVQRKDPVFFFDLTDLDNIVCKDTGEIEGFSTSLVNFGDGYLLGIGQGGSGGAKIEIYRETETGVESVAVFEREGAYISENYKSYYIDRKNQLLGLGISGYMIAENGAYVRQNNYLVLHFNRETPELEIAAELPLEGTIVTMRGVYIDGYFHMFGSNDFKTVKLQ
ncbi:MAG: beta-propeller domain-containing protein [Clostridia bacterium]|nr:beta-propeller domain-containing protein [Clostridia bacterium]